MTDFNDPVYQKVCEAKLSLVFQRPFYGYICSRMEIVDASEWCERAATDGRHFYYNREFILGLESDELIFLMGHEVLHCVLGHIGARGHRDAKTWNAACDYTINYTLINEKLGKMPRTGRFDPRFTDDMSSYEVYDFLEANKTTMTIPDPMDDHVDGQDEDDDERDGPSVKVSVSGKNGPPKLSKDEISKINSEIRSAMIEGALMARQAGQNLPTGVSKILDKLLNPVMDWRSMLDAFFRSVFTDDVTFAEPSRRSFALEAAFGQMITLPGDEDALTIDLHVAIDVSASLDMEMLRDMLSEVRGIAETFPGFKIHLWSFDTQIHNVMYCSPENIDDIDTYPLKRGGGTLFEVNFSYMKENDIVPHRLVIFTDGEPNQTWGDPNYCDCLFIIHSDPHHRRTAPFGRTAWYEKNKKS